MNLVINTIKNATKKKLVFGIKPIYEKISDTTSEMLESVERQYQFQFPPELRQSLESLGSCRINDCFYLHSVAEIYPFSKMDTKLLGHIVFASDDVGNYFAFDPREGSHEIFYCSHDPAGFAFVAKDVENLFTLLIDAKFEIDRVVEDLKLVELDP
jgi:hypothetical protein